MTTPTTSPSPVTPLDHGLSPPLTTGETHRQRTARQLRLSERASARAAPYADVPPAFSVSIDMRRASDREAIESARGRLAFLMLENERMRMQLVNAALSLGSQLDDWERRLLAYDTNELARRADAAQQRRDALQPWAATLRALTPLGNTPPPRQKEAPAAPAVEASPDVYEL